MEELKNMVKNRLSEKALDKQALGVLVFRELKKLYPDAVFDAYVRFDTLFVQSADKGLQIALFKDKKNILEIINEKLQKLGYTEELREIIFKPGKFVEKKTNPANCEAVDFGNADLCVDESEVL